MSGPKTTAFPIEAFAKLIAESRRPKRVIAPGEAQARCMATDELKALWDAFDGDVPAGAPGEFWPKDGPHIEDVHLVLNERGEGAHCAV